MEAGILWGLLCSYGIPVFKKLSCKKKREGLLRVQQAHWDPICIVGVAQEAKFRRGPPASIFTSLDKA